MELKQVDRKILIELLKDAKRSDREIAKKLGVSQPTVSRRRQRLEEEVIDGHTVIPKWDKLGYEIMAITLIKSKAALATREKYEAVRKKGSDWLKNQPAILMAGACRGLGFNAFNISIHKDYSDFDNFMRNFRLEWGEAIDETESILINLAGKEVLKPWSPKYVAETL